MARESYTDIYAGLSKSEKAAYEKLTDTKGDIIASTEANRSRLDRCLYNDSAEETAYNRPLSEAERQLITCIQEMPFYFGHSTQYPRSVFQKQALLSRGELARKSSEVIYGMTKVSDNQFGNDSFVFGTLFAEPDENRVILHRGDFFFKADIVFDKGCITFHDGFTIFNSLGSIKEGTTYGVAFGATKRHMEHGWGRVNYVFINEQGETVGSLENRFSEEYFFGPKAKEALGKMMVLHLRYCDPAFQEALFAEMGDPVQLAKHVNRFFSEIEIKIPNQVPFQGHYVGAKPHIARLGQEPAYLDQRKAEENSYYSCAIYD